MSTNKSTHIHWFGNDLRISNQTFTSRLNGKDYFFGVFVLSPLRFGYNEFGFRNMSLNRLQFLREHLIDLQNQLREKNCDLLILVGYPEEIIPKLIKKHDATLSFQKEYATDERLSKNKVKQILNDRDVYSYDGNFLVSPERLALNSNQFPKSFSGFRKKVEKLLKNEGESVSKEELEKSDEVWNKIKTLKVFPKIKPSSRSIHKLSAMKSRGGSGSAWKRINHYFEDTQLVKTYKETRNGLVGEDYSSKFSWILSSGVVSANEIDRALKNFEEKQGANKSTYWLWFELLWRDYFRHAARYYEDQMFYDSGISKKNLEYEPSKSKTNRWRTAKTQSDFINANMRELAISGFMSNRGRQNVASFLVHDLKQNWKYGAAWFEHCLLDYDVYSNQGNWMYIGGLGFNPKGGSYFDTNFQEERYDQNAIFRSTWNDRLNK